LVSSVVEPHHFDAALVYYKNETAPGSSDLYFLTKNYQKMPNLLCPCPFAAPSPILQHCPELSSMIVLFTSFIIKLIKDILYHSGAFSVSD
jgi:hypothetical protein